MKSTFLIITRPLSVLVLPLLLIGILAGTTLAGEPILTWGLGFGDEAFQKELVEEYNKTNPEHPVQLEFALAGLDGLSQATQKLRIALRTGSGPDMTGGIDTGAALESVVASGSLLQLDEIYETRGWSSKIPEGYIDMVRLDGGLYAVPINVEVAGIFYNLELLDELSLSIPRTWDEYLDAMRKAKNSGYYGFALGVAQGWPAGFMSSQFMYLSAGSQFTRVLSGEDTWAACERCLDGLNAMMQLADEGMMTPDPAGVSDDQAQALFFQGQVLSTVSGPWYIPTFLDANPEFRLGFSLMPPINDGVDISAEGGLGGTWIVNKDGNVEGALDFIDWLLSDEVATKMATERGEFSVAGAKIVESDLPPSISSAVKSLGTLVRDPDIEIGLWPITYLPPVLHDQLRGFIQGMLTKQISPKELLQRMDRAHESHRQNKQ